MKYLKLFENFNTKYLGQCDRIRKLPGGEELWHKLIANKIHISKEDFLSHVNTQDILDEDDTIEEFFGSDTNSYYAKSEIDGVVYFFISTHGFEFIWKVIS